MDGLVYEVVMVDGKLAEGNDAGAESVEKISEDSVEDAVGSNGVTYVRGPVLCGLLDMGAGILIEPFPPLMKAFVDPSPFDRGSPFAFSDVPLGRVVDSLAASDSVLEYEERKALSWSALSFVLSLAVEGRRMEVNPAPSRPISMLVRDGALLEALV